MWLCYSFKFLFAFLFQTPLNYCIAVIWTWMPFDWATKISLKSEWIFVQERTYWQHMNETYLQKSDNFRSRKKQMRKLYLSQLATVTLLPMLILFFVWKKTEKELAIKPIVTFIFCISGILNLVLCKYLFLRIRFIRFPCNLAVYSSSGQPLPLRPTLRIRFVEPI